MRAIIQRVSEASVTVGGEQVARIGPGLLVLLGVHVDDGGEQAVRMAGKIEALRVFEDDDHKMNLDVRQTGGQILLVSQFTLYGQTVKGNRPGFNEAGEGRPGGAAVRGGEGAARRAGWCLRRANERPMRQRRAGHLVCGGLAGASILGNR